MIVPTPEFPKYQYTYKVVSLSFDSPHMLVDYIPTQETLAKITLNLPIFPTFDINDVDGYVEQFAPHDKWYAQELILTHGDTLLGVVK